MRVFRALTGCIVAWSMLIALAAAEESFPYTAYVTSDDVYVRSGPGKNYYPTEKLVRGAEVEVYRHDPGGWFAIRPPQDSFSWVLAADLRQLPDRPGIAEVAKDHTLAFVGSRFSDVRDVRQVKLDRGEQVEILGEKRFVADGNSTAESWFRVAPPAGEFRWVSGRFVTKQGHPVPYAKTVQREAPSTESKTSATSPSQSAVAQTGASETRNPDAVTIPAEIPYGDTAVRQVAYNEPVDQRQPRTARANTPPRDLRKAINPEVVMIQPPTPESMAKTNAPGPLQNELDDINLKLSLMIAEEPTTWQFDALKSRANAARNGARSALERGRADSLLRDIAKYEQIRQQYGATASLRQQTEQRNELLANSAAVAADSVAPPAVDLTKFDAVGRLTPVVSRRPGAPRFALTDASGNVLTFVTPDAELPLANHVGRVLGLTGQRGFMPNLGKPHLTAKRLTELDPTVLK